MSRQPRVTRLIRYKIKPSIIGPVAFSCTCACFYFSPHCFRVMFPALLSYSYFCFSFFTPFEFFCASSGGYDAFQWSWQRRKGRHWLRGVFGFDTGKKSVSVLSKLDYKFQLEMVSKCNKRKFCKTKWRQICYCYSSTFGCHLWSVVKHTPSKMESIVCKQQRKEILSLPHSTQLFWIYFWTGHCLSLGKKGGSEKVFKGRGGGKGDSRRQQTIKERL